MNLSSHQFSSKQKIIIIFIALICLIYYSFFANVKVLDIQGPSRLVAGPNNTVYILINHTIAVVSSDGKVLSKLDLKNDLAIKEEITDFFVDQNGQLTIGLASSGALNVYAPDGKLVHAYPIMATKPLFNEPFYFKFTKDQAKNILYLSNAYSNSVMLIDYYGNVIQTLGSSPNVSRDNASIAGNTLTLSFNWPNRIVFDVNYLYVVDTNNHRIICLLSDGTFYKNINTEGKEKTPFTNPTDISVVNKSAYVISRAPSGDDGADIVAIDIDNGEHLKFDLKSASLTQHIDKKRIFTPEDILGRQDDALVSEQGLNKIYRFSRSGQFIGLFAQELATQVSREKAFYFWSRVISIVCMLPLLIYLLIIYRQQRREPVYSGRRVEQPVLKSEAQNSVQTDSTLVLFLLLILVIASFFFLVGPIYYLSPLLLNTVIIMLLLNRFGIRTFRLGLILSAVSAVFAFMYAYVAGYFVSPYSRLLMPSFGVLLFVFLESGLIYYLTRLHWLKKSQSIPVPLAWTFTASLLANLCPFFLKFIVPFSHVYSTFVMPALLVLILLSLIALIKKRRNRYSAILLPAALIIMPIAAFIIYVKSYMPLTTYARNITNMLGSHSPEDLRNPDRTVRFYASMYLGRKKDPNSVAPLIALLNDKNNEVRGLAAQTLGMIEDTRAVDSLIIALRDPFANVRSNAAKALGELKDSRAVTPLNEAMRDSDEDVRNSSVQALVRIDRVQYDRPGLKLPVKEECKAVLNALRDKSPKVRETAAWLLLRTKDSRVVTPVIALLKDEWPRTRAYAAQVLGSVEDPVAVEPLIDALSDSNEWVRQNAAAALGQFHDRRALEPLTLTLKDKDEKVRWTAATALGKLRDPRSTEPLVAVLKDENYIVRESAARSLGMIKDSRAVDPLISALKDSRQSVRVNIFFALGEVQTAQCEEVLLQGLRNRDLAVVAGAYKYFLQKGIPNTEEIMIKALKEFKSPQMAFYLRKSSSQKLREAAEEWIEHNPVIVGPYKEDYK